VLQARYLDRICTRKAVKKTDRRQRAADVTWTERVLKAIEPEDNPRNTIYGTLAAGLLIAAEDPATGSYARVVTATVVAVGIYWLAHAYAEWTGQRFRGEVRYRPSARDLADALSHEWPLAEGAAIPLIPLLVSWSAGAPLATAVPVAVWAAAAALVVFEIAGGLRRRLRVWQLLANAAIGVTLGGSLVTVKLLLH
jgi:hypothetical protein